VKQPEYTEGPQALENFRSLATAILQAPAKKQKRQIKRSASRKKPKRSAGDWTCAASPDLFQAKFAVILLDRA